MTVITELKNTTPSTTRWGLYLKRFGWLWPLVRRERLLLELGRLLMSTNFTGGGLAEYISRPTAQLMFRKRVALGTKVVWKIFAMNYRLIQHAVPKMWNLPLSKSVLLGRSILNHGNRGSNPSHSSSQSNRRLRRRSLDAFTRSPAKLARFGFFVLLRSSHQLATHLVRLKKFPCQRRSRARWRGSWKARPRDL